MAGTSDKLLTAAEIKEVTDTKVNISDVVNALNSTSTNKPLSAAQGKALNDAKVNKTDTIAIEHGGTNATSASNARMNLDVYSKSEVDTAIAQLTACKYLNDVSKTVIQLLDGDYGNLTDGEFKEYRIRASDHTCFGFVVRHTSAYAAGILCTIDPGVILHAVKRSASGSFELMQI